jgi:hypothetical protein
VVDSKPFNAGYTFLTVHRFRVQHIRVKDKKCIKDPKFSLKMLISQIIANLAGVSS